jgi:hypothetical protein
MKKLITIIIIASASIVCGQPQGGYQVSTAVDDATFWAEEEARVRTNISSGKFDNTDLIVLKGCLARKTEIAKIQADYLVAAKEEERIKAQERAAEEARSAQQSAQIEAEIRADKALKPIFYSFEAVLTRFTLLEFARIEKCSATFAVRRHICID